MNAFGINVLVLRFALDMNYLDDLSLKCSWIIIAKVASCNKTPPLANLKRDDIAFNIRYINKKQAITWLFFNTKGTTF